jgi:hypothetical protein
VGCNWLACTLNSASKFLARGRKALAEWRKRSLAIDVVHGLVICLFEIVMAMAYAMDVVRCLERSFSLKGCVN